MISNEEITLRLFEKKDISKKIEWINDVSNNAFLHYDLPLNYDKTLEWFESKNNDNRLDLVIEYQNTPVGLIGLLNIDRKNRKAEFYITIGEVSHKSKGIGTKATLLLLQIAFEKLNLKKVYLNVDSENIPAIKLYEKVGFVCEGVFIDEMFHNGRFINRKRYAIFKLDEEEK